MALKNNKKRRVIIIGAGFAGLETARLLRKNLGEGVSLTLIDQQQYQTFLPGLMKYLTGEYTAQEITISLPEWSKKKGVEFINQNIISINPGKKYVFLKKMRMAYDHLVIACGSRVNTFGIPGVKKYAHYFHSVNDVERLTTHIAQRFKKKRDIKIAVVGAGLTGVELCAYMREYLTKKYPDYNSVISLIEAQDNILPSFPQNVRKQVEAYLHMHQINIFQRTHIKHITAQAICVEKNRCILADLVIWTAGIIPPDEITHFGLRYNPTKGVYVNEYFQTVDYPTIFALGDCITFENTIKTPLIKRAQAAMKQAQYVAENIERSIMGQDLLPYHYTEMPTIISLTKSSIFVHKRVVIQSQVVKLLEWLIWKRQKWLYS